MSANRLAVLTFRKFWWPDRAGLVKFASRAAWNFVKFDYYDVASKAAPFEGARR